jgi:hypothetical protein
MKLRLSFSVLFIALASLTIPISAQSPKPPWRWTLDERLAVINDPAAAATRLRNAVQRGQVSSLAKTASTANPAPSDQVDFISGREHPELVLPSELFDHMMTMAFADDPEVRSIFREAKIPALTGSGLPADFWNRMEAISVAYLSDVRQIRDLHKRGVSDAAVKSRIAIQTHALENLKCRDRAAAIAAARHDLGEKFDQFLYEGIAPNMSIAIARLGRISEAREHEIEGGCR